jgi:hypothetical protein
LPDASRRSFLVSLVNRTAVVVVAVTGWLAFRAINVYGLFGTRTTPATFVRKQTGVYYKQGRVNRVFWAL